MAGERIEKTGRCIQKRHKGLVAAKALLLIAALCGCSQGENTASDLVEATTRTSSDAAQGISPDLPLSGPEGTDEPSAVQADSADAVPDSTELVPGDLWTRDDYLAMMADLWGVQDPPDVGLVREIRPEEEGEVMRSCMAEYGFTIEVDFNGGWGGTYSVDQTDLWHESAFRCVSKYPLIPVFYQPYDEATLERIHEYLSTVVAPCFAERGYPVEVPTFGTFKAEYDYDRSIAGAFVGSPTALWGDCNINIPSEVILPR